MDQAIDCAENGEGHVGYGGQTILVASRSQGAAHSEGGAAPVARAALNPSKGDIDIYEGGCQQIC